MKPRRPPPDSRSRSPWRWAVGGAAVGAVGAVLVFAPASWLAAGLAQASAERVRLLDPRGTVWQGSGLLQLTGGAGSRDVAVLPGRVQWHLQPRWSGLAATLRADCCTPEPLRLDLALQPRGAVLGVDGGGTSDWPTGLLAGLGAPWNTLQLDGRLVLRTEGLRLHWAAGRLELDGAAELLARDVASALSPLKPLGSYRLRVEGGATPTLSLQTVEGALQLSGAGRWVGQRLHFQGEARAAPEREAALSNLLNLLGRRNGPRSLISLG